MKNWKTTLAGLLTGLPVAADAIIKTAAAGGFTGKTGLELVGAIGLVLLGLFSKDHDKTGV